MARIFQIMWLVEARTLWVKNSKIDNLEKKNAGNKLVQAYSESLKVILHDVATNSIYKTISESIPLLSDLSRLYKHVSYLLNFFSSPAFYLDWI